MGTMGDAQEKSAFCNESTLSQLLSLSILSTVLSCWKTNRHLPLPPGFRIPHASICSFHWTIPSCLLSHKILPPRTGVCCCTCHTPEEPSACPQIHQWREETLRIVSRCNCTGNGCDWWVRAMQKQAAMVAASSDAATSASGNGSGSSHATSYRFTKLSKIICGVLALGCAAGYASPEVANYVALVPGKTLPYVWNVFTCSYFEQRVVSLVASCISLLVLGSVLEPVWGSKEFLKFLFLVNLSVGCCAFVACLITYFALYKEQMLYGKLSGFQGCIAALVVGIKQVMPDQEIVFLKFVTIKVKHFPLLLVTAAVAGNFLGLPMDILLFVAFGTFNSWVYLRFLQTHPQSRLQGDPSEHFSFAGFFPEFMQSTIEIVTVPLSKLFRLNRRNTQNMYALGGQPLPGSAPIDASRRRERGAKALEERLASAGGVIDTQAAGEPSVENGGEGEQAANNV